MSFKQFIGRTATPAQAVIDPESVMALSKVLNGESKPQPRVPLIYLTRFRKSEFEILEQMGIPLKDVLHGEQVYEYQRPLEVGQTIHIHSKLKNVIEKKGSQGMLILLIFETLFNGDTQGTLLARAETVIVVRRKEGV